MDSLLAAIGLDAAVQKLQERFAGKPGETLAYGLSGSQKHVAFAACYRKSPQPWVVLVHNSDMVSAWREDLEALLPEATVVELPELDIVNVQAAAKSIERSARRMDVLGRLMRQEPVIVLATSAAAVQKGMSRNEFERLSLGVRIGQQLPREELLARLVQLGYEHAEEVERVGQFSSRGGIVDVYAINSPAPVRMEFFDDEIDSLREFDLATKRSIRNISSTAILPLAQTDDAGRPELFLTYLEKKGAVLFDEPIRIREQIKTMVKENPDIRPRCSAGRICA